MISSTQSLSSFAGKRILLGISGGIAAYKCPELVRLLLAAGAEVRVVMTDAAQAFITPLTVQAVSQQPVYMQTHDVAAEAAMSHIALAKWADLIIIAPASANVIARLALGFADDLLTTLCLASAAPCAIAPAMNQQMYRSQRVQKNLATLAEQGVNIWGPAVGLQACGDDGPGRLLEPTVLVTHIENFFTRTQDLRDWRILITAGPTREALDPVRYFTNDSSGKMGFALADAASTRGAQVTLISGPVSQPTPFGVTRINVQSALEMYEAVHQHIQQQHVFIGCAAVADYRPEHTHTQKMKKTKETLTLTLVRNPDIIASVAAMTTQRPFVVGFAAETEQVAQHAQQKLLVKNIDLICANDVSHPDEGFNSDMNRLHLYWATGERLLPHCHKRQLADLLLNEIEHHYATQRRT